MTKNKVSYHILQIRNIRLTKFLEIAVYWNLKKPCVEQYLVRSVQSMYRMVEVKLVYMALSKMIFQLRKDYIWVKC